MARNRAGTKFEHDDPTKAEAPIPRKNAEELAAEEAEVLKSEKLPDNFKEALDLLAQLTVEPVSTRAEWDAKQPKLRALKKHVHNLQQGLPVIPSSANDHAAGWASRLASDNSRILEHLAITTPAVKELLEKCAELEAKIVELTPKTETE